MAWNVWAEGVVLHAASLNENMSLITAVLHSITGGQMADNAINAGAIIAVDIVDETHLDYADTVNAVRCLQIGKDTGTHQQMLVKGTCANTVQAVTIQDVTFTYSNADLVTGDPAFNAVPHVIATVYTDDTDYVCDVKEAGTQNCVIQVGPGAGNIVTTNTNTVYVIVVGDI